ncbi:hypothetical protein BOX15_Mlig019745g1 [Macrostomum lignano]|uniref:Nuclear-export cofactor Arc1-like N-terminal domain-containing protein n=1 Tax=Macrostomum lignano TaxID=282301 RepID=A0A267EGL8_9PLAT|nr:hypothetical protein BOX15_Mlig010996g4 [Macrostomum lignano]PAA60671.1 hypothetical protein BOX15_Mlig010996g1 [Macrostomum lignano]PAA69093.1 hypothetical protein BOX15_Mlig019745g1 [Macrostomum lignano]
MLAPYQATVREFGGSLAGRKLTFATPDEELLTYELLEFRALQLRRMANEADEQRALRLLNERYLAGQTYLLGERLTAIDLLLYKDLGGYVTERWTCQEKERFANITRWFSHLHSLMDSASCPRFYPSLPVHFQRMPLYS